MHTEYTISVDSVNQNYTSRNIFVDFAYIFCILE